MASVCARAGQQLLRRVLWMTCRDVQHCGDSSASDLALPPESANQAVRSREGTPRWNCSLVLVSPPWSRLFSLPSGIVATVGQAERRVRLGAVPRRLHQWPDNRRRQPAERGCRECQRSSLGAFGRYGVAVRMSPCVATTLIVLAATSLATPVSLAVVDRLDEAPRRRAH
jgi:hypothetical protein